MDGAMTNPAAGATACGLCGGVAAIEVRPETFTYGSGADAVDLTVDVPVTSCASCDEAYTGEEGEVLRHAAVCRHLGRMTPAEIEALRVRRGWAQWELALAAQVDEDDVARWERGNRIQSPDQDDVLRMLQKEC